ncbi:MAG TPA: aminodeoxychorismate/anthranilate synthase component II [Flavobacteriales bacterium]|nr:aminodeoxychorismate/anthranilate synthase component II [Flavobacteriales bacterium]|tara:strand:+ start:193 stop:816 length:624 start_codon:yes stop_codon:yes gene_type:complete
MRILLVDNYDSFTWNIEHILVSVGAQVDVVRNDVINPHAVVQFDGLVLSPGPGVPNEAGQLMRIIPIAAAHSVPTLGVCLGMQAIAEHFGGRLCNLENVMHGQASHLTESIAEGLLAELQPPIQVGHYHSWVVDEKELPANLEITARNSTGLPMALRHRTLPLEAVQFHPESILTPDGKKMLSNWLSGVAAYRKVHPVDRSAIPIWL